MVQLNARGKHGSGEKNRQNKETEALVTLGLRQQQ
jgi:hypothetical protein